MATIPYLSSTSYPVPGYCARKAAPDSRSGWGLWYSNGKLLSFGCCATWISPCHCGHTESGAVDEQSLSLSHSISLFLSFFQIRWFMLKKTTCFKQLFVTLTCHIVIPIHIPAYVSWRQQKVSYVLQDGRPRRSSELLALAWCNPADSWHWRR